MFWESAVKVAAEVAAEVAAVLVVEFIAVSYLNLFCPLRYLLLYFYCLLDYDNQSKYIVALCSVQRYLMLLNQKRYCLLIVFIFFIKCIRLVFLS